MSELSTGRPKYWWCVRHQAVESGEVCPPLDRLGPFASAEEAAKALELAERRNQEWEEWDNE